MPHYSSFVIKIWVDEGKIVRGEIRHVGTQECIHFADAGKISEFVMSHLSPAQIDSPGHDQSMSTIPMAQHGQTPKHRL